MEQLTLFEEKAIPKELLSGSYKYYECECKQDLNFNQYRDYPKGLTREERRAWRYEYLEDNYIADYHNLVYKKCPNCGKLIDWDKCWTRPTRKIFCMYFDNAEDFDKYKVPSKKAIECWDRYRKTKGVDYECFIDAERGREHEPRPKTRFPFFLGC